MGRAVGRYSLTALGLATGAGILGGWWLGRRSRPALPPPPPPPRLIDTAAELIRDYGEKLGSKRRDADSAQSSATPLEYIEAIFPHGVEKVRRALPPGAPEEAARLARNWMETTLEPAVQEGLERAATRAMDSKFGSFFKDALQRFELEGDGDANPGSKL